MENNTIENQKLEDNGNEKGKEAEDFVESELLRLNIPYKRNIKYKNKYGVRGSKKFVKGVVSEFDFVIPNAIIEVKASFQVGNYSDLKRDAIISQLQKQLKIIPNNFTIYLFIKEKINDESLKKSFEFCKRIKILDSIDQITREELPIVIEDIKCIKSLASLENTNIDNLIKHYNNKIINLAKDKYNKIVSFLNDKEMIQLKEFKFKLYEDENNYENFILITNQKWKSQQSKKDRMFNVFYEFIDYFEIKSKYPLRCIKEISDTCEKCDKIFMVQFLNKQICFKCLGVNLTEFLNNNNKRKFDDQNDEEHNCKRRRT